MSGREDEPMTAEGWLPVLGIVLFLDLLALLGAAIVVHLRLVALAAATFVAIVAIIAIVSNAHYWQRDRIWSREERQSAMVSNTRLLALTYFWGALAMQGLYITPLTGLKWQHGWQYASAMLLIASLTLVYAWKLERGARTLQQRLVGVAVPMTILQGIGGAMGVTALVVTGKLFTWRPDWAANQIFLFGALLVMVLSAVTLRTHKALSRDAAPRP